VAKKLTFEVERNDRETVLHVTGEVNIDTSPDLRDRLIQLGSNHAPRLVVDLSGVTYIASSGLATLVEAVQRARDAEADLILRGVNLQVKQVFTLARLEKVFTFDSDPTD